MKPLAAAIEALGVQSAWLDGEIVVLGPTGHAGLPSAAERPSIPPPARPIDYFLFDLPFVDGFDLRAVPLQLSAATCCASSSSAPAATASASAPTSWPMRASILASVRRARARGHRRQARRLAATCRSAATTWLKLKCMPAQEFVIGGYIAARRLEHGGRQPAARRTTAARAQLQYVGNVGTGWSAQAATELRQQLQKIELKASPFAGTVAPGRWTRRASGQERWVEPQLVAQVRFADWTPAGPHPPRRLLGPARRQAGQRGRRSEVALPTASAPRAACAR